VLLNYPGKAEVQSGGRVPCDDRLRTESGVEASSSQQIWLGATVSLATALNLGLCYSAPLALVPWLMHPRLPLPSTE